MDDKWFEWQVTPGESVVVGETTITPMSQALVMRLPFAGFVWNRPASVLVERQGQSEELPMMNVTRTAVLTLAAMGVIIPLFLRLLRGGK